MLVPVACCEWHQTFRLAGFGCENHRGAPVFPDSWAVGISWIETRRSSKVPRFQG
jgi:hypothetical protein